MNMKNINYTPDCIVRTGGGDRRPGLSKRTLTLALPVAVCACTHFLIAAQREP